MLLFSENCRDSSFSWCPPDGGQQHDVPCTGTTLGAWSRFWKFYALNALFLLEITLHDLFCLPIYWDPLFADIVMHSATKFVSGHSDVMAGVLAVKDERLHIICKLSCYSYNLGQSVQPTLAPNNWVITWRSDIQ